MRKLAFYKRERSEFGSNSDEECRPTGNLQTREAASRQVLVEDDLAPLVEDALVHAPGMQIDAAVESELLGVETRTWYSLGMGPVPELALWLAGTSCLKIPL
jgi:hypothetical protein